MTAPATITVPRQRAIPDSLVYEVMDGKKIYYRNYVVATSAKAHVGQTLCVCATDIALSPFYE